MDDANKILDFWFSEKTKPNWFAKNPEFDSYIKYNFESILSKAESDELSSWENHPNSTLALIILFDQFPRNMYRGTPKAFAFDEKALQLANMAIDNKYDKLIEHERLSFLYMPFMHCESLEIQNISVEIFKEYNNQINLDYAIQHREIIKKFGRFPHRNKILGRKSTQEELDFLLENPGF